MLPSHSTSTINTIIEDLESFCLRIDSGLVQRHELSEKFYTAKDYILQNVLKNNTDEWRIFDNWCQGYLYRMRDKPGYAKPEEKEKIEKLIDILKKILNQNTPHLVKNERSFSPSEEYQAKRYVLNILQNAQKKIIIVDNYLDEKIFDFIDTINESIAIFLLTDSKKPVFINLYKSIIKSRISIKARINNISHDRYLIIDDNTFYHIGASLNTIGKKAFMINKIQNEVEKREKLNQFNNWWQNAKDIQ